MTSTFLDWKKLKSIVQSRHRWHGLHRWAALTGFVFMVGYIPVRIEIATWSAPKPQAILTLGGGEKREMFAAEFARNHPDLDIWISSGLEREKAEAIFRAAKIDLSRVHQDRKATDTVTNFTTMLAKFEQEKINHIYLVTSAEHMPRATAIATLVLGSRGIAVTSVTVPSVAEAESPWRTIRDVIRSTIWIFTGWTGAEFRQDYQVTQLNDQLFGAEMTHESANTESANTINEPR
ncbi:YdcF family protein [Alkalinema pantanalense CENA528]|uniref:YdcF family protein n=1 Tax=Alkalinema pantanalense TaxID=1620705 RepID=UPI003D6DF88F